MTEPLATVTNYNELVDAFRSAKDRLALSNAFCDEAFGLTRGHLDKVLGPTRAKNISPMIFDVLCSGLAVRFVMLVDVNAAQRMEPKWEQRETRNVRTGQPVSKVILERAKPHVLKAHMKAANTARNSMLTCEQRSAIARHAAKKRWRKWRKERNLSRQKNSTPKAK